MVRKSLAVFRKEWRTEMRQKHGLFTSSLFSVLAVAAMAFAAQTQKPQPTLAAGMLTVVLLFAATTSIARLFLVEDEQGTFEFLRMVAPPRAVFNGKIIYGSIQMLVTGLVLAMVFVAAVHVEVRHPVLFLVALVSECLVLAAASGLCGALVIGASNRWLLASVLSLPMLLPQTAMAVSAIRVSLGEGFLEGGWSATVGLLGFLAALYAVGPWLVESVWRREK